MLLECVIDLDIGDPHALEIPLVIRKITWHQAFFPLAEVAKEIRESQLALVSLGENQCADFY